jgi:hypothetical protein
VPSTYDLVEYYIVEKWVSYNPSSGAENKGTFTDSEGATYTLARSVRNNMPSIDGTKTFYQYWSIRNSPRTSGTIHVADHFAAWEAAGMPLGNLYEVTMVAEGYHSDGHANVQMSMQ